MINKLLRFISGITFRVYCPFCEDRLKEIKFKEFKSFYKCKKCNKGFMLVLKEAPGLMPDSVIRIKNYTGKYIP